MNHFDLIIIGGGPAGMMTAISAKRHNPRLSVAILDRTFSLGRKILVCGAGRCNITNINLNDQISERYHGAPIGFVESVINQFGYLEIVEFFNDLGIDLYVERKTDIGKVFPVTNQAKTVTELLLDEIERSGIQVFLNAEVSSVTKGEDGFGLSVEITEPEVKSAIFTSGKLVIATGGKTYPALGSNGSGYDLARQLGHTIVAPVPSALPLEAKNKLSQLVQGLKLEVEVTSIIDDKDIKTRTDDVMFTKYGLSGPAILNISREISVHFNREVGNECRVRLNFLPGKTKKEIRDLFDTRWQKRQDQSVEKSLYGLFPNKFAQACLKVLEIEGAKSVKDLSGEEKGKIIELIGGYEVPVSGTRGWNEAEFTAGGVDTGEVDSTRLESRLVPGLYFAGEILNVDGDVGGFNLSWSWSSGYIAGKLS